MLKLKDQIMLFHDGIRSTREIADLVYGEPATSAQVAYVRVVTRQRKGTASSKADLAYWRKPGIKKAHRASGMAKYHTGDRVAARIAATAAYAKFRKQGLSAKEACRRCGGVYSTAMRATGNVLIAMELSAQVREAASA